MFSGQRMISITTKKYNWDNCKSEPINLTSMVDEILESMGSESCKVLYIVQYVYTVYFWHCFNKNWELSEVVVTSATFAYLIIKYTYCFARYCTRSSIVYAYFITYDNMISVATVTYCDTILLGFVNNNLYIWLRSSQSKLNISKSESTTSDDHMHKHNYFKFCYYSMLPWL